jgi:hypothetical protein
MKTTYPIYNGFLIFIGIAIYFLIINLIGFADNSFLRLFNSIFVIYGVYKTLAMNIQNGNDDMVNNAKSGLTTSIVGVGLSVIGLIIYSYLQGGDIYVQQLSKTLLFGGNPSVIVYSICLLFEGIASSVVITLMSLLYFSNKYVVD